MADFFISYSSADRAWAEWIAWELEQAGYTAIIQAWDFRPGSNFVIEMKKAADECERTIAVLSPNYIGTIYTHEEWAVAFVRDPTGEKALLVPVRVRPCEISNFLKAVIYIDIVGKSEVVARNEILNDLRLGRRLPDEKLSFLSSARKPKRFPGALPEIWNVPHLRNPNFTGRDQLLSNLHSAFGVGKIRSHASGAWWRRENTTRNEYAPPLRCRTIPWKKKRRQPPPRIPNTRSWR